MTTRKNVKQPKKRTLRVTPKPWWVTSPLGIFSDERDGQIIQGDARRTMQDLGDESIDIVFLDPPFNLGKNYGRKGPAGDRLEDSKYRDFLISIIAEATRVLKPGGALYLYHIPKWAVVLSASMDKPLIFRHWIAISMKNGFVRGKGLYPAHYALLYYTKGVPAISKRPKIDPSICPHCGEYTKDYGGYASHVANGVNLSDVWDDLSPVRHSRYKNRKANELPLTLVQRVLEISGRRGGVVLDPFAGTGTSVIASKLARMKYIAIDREVSNCRLMRKRLDDLAARRKKKVNA